MLPTVSIVCLARNYSGQRQNTTVNRAGFVRSPRVSDRRIGERKTSGGPDLSGPPLKSVATDLLAHLGAPAAMREQQAARRSFRPARLATSRPADSPRAPARPPILPHGPPSRDALDACAHRAGSCPDRPGSDLSRPDAC